MISINEIKNGLFIKLEGELYVVVEAEPYKPGKGGALMRTKLRNFKTGSTLDRTFRSADTIEDVYIEEKTYQYLYGADGQYHFMDTETYEQISLSELVVGDAKNFLKENIEVGASMYEGKILHIKLPLFMKYKVVETELGARGDTVKAGTKSAKIETGATVQVPLFISNGEIITIDTRTGKYTGRA
ncbi:MAG: elongation factor P [Candidatus Omnitrophica bacterium]|nr:elongation factor P [Candidatus Omnitrophota bacterium]